MKKLYILLFTFLIVSASIGQTTVFQESFETGNSGTPSETCNDGTDFFTRTDGTDINNYVVSGGDGSFFFAAQDTDGAPCTSAVETLTFTGINISTFTNMTLAVLVAEDDSGDGAEDWDANTNVVFEINIDGSGYTPVLQFSGGGATNTEPGLDSDFDGTADGTPLIPTFQEFTAVLGAGTSADLRITFNNLDAGDEDIAIDNIRIIDDFTVTPNVTVTSPTDNATFPSGTTTVNVEFTTANTNPGDQVNITVNGGTPSTNVTSPFGVSTTDGTSYSLLVELVDSGSNLLDSETVNFEVLFPCELQIGTITTVCDAETAGIDTYTTSIAFTGGNTSQYTIDTGGVGTLGGDNPTGVAAGTLTITGVNEGTDFSIAFSGDPANSSCDITRNITSPVCVSATCANAGDIIITEVMQNPAAASDPAGEYFELYNSTASAVNVQGWIIKDDVSTGETHTISSSLEIPANGYIVIGNSATTTPVLDYNYGNDISLGNSTDGLILECSTTVIDQVIWDNGATFPDPSGASMEFSNTFLARLNNTDNDNGANWGESTNPLGNGDFGTPGAANDFALSSESFELKGISIYPNPTNTGFVNITSQNSEVLEAKVFDILGKQVLEGKVENNKLDVSNLNAGMYILKLSQNNASVTKKLVIQ